MNKCSRAVLIWCVLFFAITTHAQDFDQHYSTWKTKQQQVQSTSLPKQQASNPQSVALNTATAVELQQKLSGIGEKKAQLIIQYRQQHGAFKHIDELKNVKGIGDKLFEKNRAKLRL